MRRRDHYSSMIRPAFKAGTGSESKKITSSLDINL